MEKFSFKRLDSFNFIQMSRSGDGSVCSTGSLASNYGASTFVKRKVRQARKQKNDYEEESSFVERAGLSYRCLTLIGGIFLAIACCLDYYGLVFQNLGRGKDLPNFIILMVMAFIVIQVEGQPYCDCFPIKSINKLVILLLPPLKRPWGRGAFYFLLGLYQYYQFTVLNMASGVIFFFLGFATVLLHLQAALRLAVLRVYLREHRDLRFVFVAFDDDRDGYLNLQEFSKMFLAFEEFMHYNLRVATFSAIDIHNKQLISYHDFKTWYDNFDDSVVTASEAFDDGHVVLHRRRSRGRSWDRDRRDEDEKSLHLLV